MLMRTATHPISSRSTATPARNGLPPRAPTSANSLDLMGALTPFARNVEIYALPTSRRVVLRNRSALSELNA